MLPIVSLNGHILGDHATAISVFDRGFLLGDGVFETLRVGDGTAWYLDRHLDRLRHATDRLGLEYPAQLPAWITEALHHAAQVAQVTQADSALRITITRGGNAPQPLSGMPGTTGTAQNSTVAITISELPNTRSSVYEQGLSAHIAAGVRNERGLLRGIKTTSYVESVLALRDAHRAGFDDAIFLDTHGFVSEATSSNIFVVIDGTLITPSLTHGALPGITRVIVLELARQLGIPVAEREVRYQELLDANEAFLTSSLRGIAPLVRVDDVTIGRGVPEATTHRIMAAYANHAPRI